VLALSRQNLPVLDRKALASASGVQRGGYVVWEASLQVEVILIGTGSELHIALDAGKLLQESGISARVVSLPSWELFDSQSAEYRNQVLPPEITARVSVEAGVTMGWERYIGALGAAVGLSGFGASGKGPDVYKYFGLTPERVAEEAKRVLGLE
jgi:transketolase